jgi:hypothetical protein
VKPLSVVIGEPSWTAAAHPPEKGLLARAMRDRNSEPTIFFTMRDAARTCGRRDR